MPHPEHAIDPLTGPGADGLGFFTSAVRQVMAGVSGTGTADTVAAGGRHAATGRSPTPSSA